MKKLVLSTTLLSIVLLGSIQNTSADEVKKAETPVGIEFEKIGDQVDGPYKGVLTLPFKPSILEFGKYKVTGAQITAPAKNIGGTNPKEWLVVNDDRDNENPIAGADQEAFKGGTWNLTATMDELSDGTTVIPASLNMSFEPIQKYDIGTNLDADGDYIPQHPNAGGVTGALIGDHKIILTKTVKLESGKIDETPILKKNEKTTDKVGVATELKSANLILQPLTTYKGGKLTSKVTWTLSTGI